MGYLKDIVKPKAQEVISKEAVDAIIKHNAFDKAILRYPDVESSDLALDLLGEYATKIIDTPISDKDARGKIHNEFEKRIDKLFTNNDRKILVEAAFSVVVNNVDRDKTLLAEFAAKEKSSLPPH